MKKEYMPRVISDAMSKSVCRACNTPQAEYFGSKYLDTLKKERARNLTKSAIRSGKLKRGPCEKCGGFPSEAHHRDYSNHMDIEWLCAGCHREHHLRIRRSAKAIREKLRWRAQSEAQQNLNLEHSIAQRSS